MFLIWLAILISILGIIIQDLSHRMVYVFWFPVLIAAFIILHSQNNFQDATNSIFFNLLFLITQFLLISIYFSLKRKKWINIFNSLLGLGDVLFLISIAFYFSVLNFFLFYISSLIYAIISWTLWLLISRKKDIRIPLAGLQAMFFIVFVFGDWLSFTINLTSDNWIYKYLI